MAALRPSLQQILQPVESDLRRVTERLLQDLQNPVARQAVYLITAGGKRLRPALVLLAGRSGARKAGQPSLIDLSAAIELTHTATLIHDDIIDQAVTRRKQPTFHERFGVERAVLMGDYLYATAFSILARVGDAAAMAKMSEVCQQMSRGEFLEVESRFNVDLTEARYLEIVRDKTASLIAASCELGAFVGGAKPETVERLKNFGLNFGMAFQIMDDCLDVIGQERMVGKPLRADLDKGCLSLPMIYLAGSLPAPDRERLFGPLRHGAPQPSLLARLAGAAKRSGAIEQALQTAGRFVEEATGAIAQRDGVVLVDTYRQLARYALQRVQ